MMELSARLKKLQDRLFHVEYQNSGVWYFEDVNILEIPEYKHIAKEPMVVRKAYAHRFIGENLPAIIKPDELIVGNPNQNSVAWGSTIPRYFTEEERARAASHELDESSVWGHHPPAYEKILQIGVSGVKEEVNNALQKELAKKEPDALSVNEFRGMMIALDSIVIFARRHADEAIRMMTQCKDETRKAELKTIYEICMHVPEYPARTLWEAVTSYWLTYCILNSGGEFIPIGRADQYLYPYYKNDLHAGRITDDDAIDLIGSFLVKCNEKIIIDTKKAENHYSFGMFSQGRVIHGEKEEADINGTGGYATRGLTWQEDEDINSEANFNYGQSGNDWLMNCMVGGVDEQGNDATNRISYLFVDIMHSMKLIMPTLGVRLHKNTPDSFLKLIAEVLRYGQGEPIIYNDRTIIPGFLELGVPIEDARNYCSDGCWETLVCGKTHFSYGMILSLQCLEWALNNGVSVQTGAKEGLETGDLSKFTDFETLYQALIQQLYSQIDFQCQRRVENLGLSYEIAPDPLFSSFTYDCVKNGRDIAQNGARYIMHMILCAGLADTVDSLAAIKKFVYEENKVSLVQLVSALRDNWKGHERLRALMINKAPKFGNDEDYVDDISVRLLHDFQLRVQKWQNELPKLKFPCGIGTFENYAVLGRDTGASANGRYSGDALAPNYSPVAGFDVNGPASVFKSIAKADLKRFFAGTPVDIAVNSNEFADEVGVQRLKDLIDSFCELGGQILTITSTNVEDLRDAQVHPEKHRDLRIRMGGLSAYFIAMAPAQQENIIKRFSR